MLVLGSFVVVVVGVVVGIDKGGGSLKQALSALGETGSICGPGGCALRALFGFHSASYKERLVSNPPKTINL